jgi:DNA polymerase-3 subunit delta'
VIFPWQTEQWQQLTQSKLQNRLPHALLLTGAAGIGKKQFAITFAHTVLCEKPDASGTTCQTCHACHLVQAQTHSDFLIIEPEQGSQIIKIDQVRDIIHLVNETPLHGGYRVIIIHPANAMNTNAANALLKTLEEPAANTLFILISDHSTRLPATISSRCQKIIFHKPATETALTWLKSECSDSSVDVNLLLKLTEGSPLKAKEILTNDLLKLREELHQGLQKLSQKNADPLQFAAQWQEADLNLLFNLLLSWIKDFLRFKLTEGTSDLINADCKTIFAELDPKISQQNLLRFAEETQQTYKNTLRSINLNRQLLLEELFIHWTHYVSC